MLGAPQCPRDTQLRANIASLHTRASNLRGRELDQYSPAGQSEASSRFSVHTFPRIDCSLGLLIPKQLGGARKTRKDLEDGVSLMFLES